MLTSRPRRLHGVSYTGLQRYFITTCTAFRRPIFDDRLIATDIVSKILRTAAPFRFAVLAYCAMPDHVHLLLVAEHNDADLTRFVKHAKQVTGFAYRQTTGDPLWQPGYHERVLRDDEGTLAVAKYILENPVRARLAKTVGEWPHAGSGVYSWPELLTAWEQETRRV
jgi:putative transposase